MQNSTLSLVIPYNNKAQNEGSINKMRISSGFRETVHFAYFKGKKDATAL
jgi:hypothetical protein